MWCLRRSSKLRSNQVLSEKINARTTGKSLLLAFLVFLPGICLQTSVWASADMVAKTCEKIGNKLSSVSIQECNALGFVESGFYSVNKQPILIKEFPPLIGVTPKARILLIGGTHGDELTSISVIFKWLKTLQEHHSGLFHWRVTPLMNPDGALKKKHSRVNANGVDLNRNFIASFSGVSPYQYWVKKWRNKRRYPGKEPLSEPETQWLYDEIHQFKPDVIVALHAPFKLVDYDAPDRGKAPRRIGHLYKNLMGTYPGSLGNYAGVQLGIPVVTIELPHAGIMPSKQQISHFWTDLVRWLISYTSKNTGSE